MKEIKNKSYIPILQLCNNCLCKFEYQILTRKEYRIMETKTIEFDEWIHTGVVSHWAPGHVALVDPPVEGVGICPTVPWLSRIHDLDIPNYHTKILMFRILVLSSLTC